MMSEEAKMDQKKKEGDGLKKTVAFMAGLSLYQLPYLAMAAAKYSLARFQIPMSLLSLYISRMIVLFRVLSLIGIALLTLYSQCKGPYQRQMTAGFFIAFSLCFVFLFLIYCTGGEQGHLTLYYWGLGAASFLLGAAFTTIVDIVTENVVFLLLSLPLTGVFVSIFHLTFIFFWELFGLSNINYWLVVCQLIIAICITSINALLYTIAYWGEGDGTGKPNGQASQAAGNNGGESGSNTGTGSSATPAQGQTSTQEDTFFQALGKAWSPILLISLGYGIHNAFYPGIAPYKLTDVKTAYNIDLAVLFTSALAPLSILILKDKKMGPDVQWIKGNSIWHASWIFFVIEMTCATIFICGLHSPGAAISRAVKSSPAILGLMTVTYDLCAQLTRSIGTNGADMQSYEKRSNSAMNTLNSFSYGFTQVIFASMGDGYLKTYSKYEHDRSKWPTQHFGILRSFWFWYWTATKVSFKAIGGSFCLDVRGAIQTKKEVLFIVYSDEVDNSSKPPKAENPKVMKIVYDI